MSPSLWKSIIFPIMYILLVEQAHYSLERMHSAKIYDHYT